MASPVRTWMINCMLGKSVICHKNKGLKVFGYVQDGGRMITILLGRRLNDCDTRNEIGDSQQGM